MSSLYYWKKKSEILFSILLIVVLWAQYKKLSIWQWFCLTDGYHSFDTLLIKG